jgi:hypothetical protein
MEERDRLNLPAGGAVEEGGTSQEVTAAGVAPSS